MSKSRTADQFITIYRYTRFRRPPARRLRLDVQAVQGAVGIINALGADMPPEQAGKLLEPFKGQAQPLSLLVKLLKKYRIAYKEEPWHEVDVKKLFDEALAYVNAPVEKAMDAIR